MQTTKEIMIGAEKYASKLGFYNGSMRDDVVGVFIAGAVDALSKADPERHGAKTYVWKTATGKVKNFLAEEKSERVASLDRMGADLDDGTIYDTLADSNAINPADDTQVVDMVSRVHQAIGTLSELQQDIIRGRYFEDKTLLDLANEKGITKEAIRQQQDKAEKILSFRI